MARIRQLEEHSFAATDFDAFEQVMFSESRAVTTDVPGFKLKPCSLRYMNFEMTFDVVSLDDEWSFRVQARMRTLAVSIGALARLPWEDLYCCCMCC